MPLLQYKRLQAGLLFQEANHSHVQGPQCFNNCWSSSSCFQETFGKIENDPQDFAQTEGHVELPYAVTSLIWLNTSALSDPHLLFVFLISLLILSQNHLNKILFWALIDSKSTHCFVDSKILTTWRHPQLFQLLSACLMDYQTVLSPKLSTCP